MFNIRDSCAKAHIFFPRFFSIFFLFCFVFWWKTFLSVYDVQAIWKQELPFFFNAHYFRTSSVVYSYVNELKTLAVFFFNTEIYAKRSVLLLLYGCLALFFFTLYLFRVECQTRTFFTHTKHIWENVMLFFRSWFSCDFLFRKNGGRWWLGDDDIIVFYDVWITGSCNKHYICTYYEFSFSVFLKKYETIIFDMCMTTLSIIWIEYSVFIEVFLPKLSMFPSK